jgi:hypothetical protein
MAAENSTRLCLVIQDFSHAQSLNGLGHIVNPEHSHSRFGSPQSTGNRSAEPLIRFYIKQSADEGLSGDA